MTAHEDTGNHPPVLSPEDFDLIRGLAGDMYDKAAAGTYGMIESGVVKQIYAVNEDFLPGGQFFDRTGTLVSHRHMPDVDEIFSLGVDIGASIVERSKSTRQIILGYLNACVWIDTARIAFRGMQSDTRLMSNLSTYVRRQITDSIPLDARTRNLINVLNDALANAHDQEITQADTLAWVHTRLTILDTELIQAMHFKDRVSEYYEQTGDIPEADMERVEHDVRLLNAHSMASRKYGTKPAYTEASIGGSWIFYDGDEYRRNILREAHNVVLPRFAAVVYHSPLTELGNVRMGIDSHSFNGMGDLKYIGGGLGAAQPDFHVVIGLDGTINFDYECLQPIDRLLAGNPQAAQKLKAEIASNFYDLSMPIDDNSPKLPRNYSGMSELERRDFDPVLRLLVPRIRRLTEPEPPTVEKPRTVREHDVVWFVRPLPQGWKASPEAIENARRVGVTLEPNETFVRAHKRGLGHSVAGYHAVRRTMDLEPGEDY
jgi:hypothetical protein